ncbi:MAG: hypothetical protein LBR26_15460 [Prevotella sp.]|jgi:hypothetical protein|nr:hypothetical protein [Prevotella sp.]
MMAFVFIGFRAEQIATKPKNVSGYEDTKIKLNTTYHVNRYKISGLYFKETKNKIKGEI